jgi:hypothetical protein
MNGMKGSGPMGFQAGIGGSGPGEPQLHPNMENFFQYVERSFKDQDSRNSL